MLCHCGRDLNASRCAFSSCSTEAPGAGCKQCLPQDVHKIPIHEGRTDDSLPYTSVLRPTIFCLQVKMWNHPAAVHFACLGLATHMEGGEMQHQASMT